MKKFFRRFKRTAFPFMFLLLAFSVFAIISLRGIVDNQEVGGAFDERGTCSLDFAIFLLVNFWRVVSVLYLVVISLRMNFVFNAQKVVRYGKPSVLWRKHFLNSTFLAFVWVGLIFVLVAASGAAYHCPFYNWDNELSQYFAVNHVVSCYSAWFHTFVFLAILVCRFMLMNILLQASHWLFQSPMAGFIASIIYIFASQGKMLGFYLDDVLNEAQLTQCAVTVLFIIIYYFVGFRLSLKKEFYEKNFSFMGLYRIKVLLKAIWTDLKMYFFQYWMLVLPAILMSLGFAMTLRNSTLQLAPEVDLNVLDMMLYMFFGTPEFNSAADIHIPLMWLAVFFYLLFICGVYIKKLTEPYQVQVFMRSGRNLWLVKNVMVIICLTLIYYILLTIPPLLLSGGRLTAVDSLVGQMYGYGLTTFQTAILGVAGPLMAMIVSGLLMLALSSLVSTVYAFALTAAFYIVGLFVNSSALFTNWGMFLRSRFAAESGLTMSKNVLFFVLYTIAALIIYFLNQQKRDWLSSHS